MEALDTGSSSAVGASSSAQALLSTAASSPSLPSSSSSAAAAAPGAAASSTSSSASASGPLVSSSDANPRNPSFNASLARDASALFHSGRYQECIDLLHQILVSDPENPKVLHNIAVVEYFRDGCTDPQKLLDLLSNVKKKIEELCQKNAREQWDDVSALPSNSPPNVNSSGPKGKITGTNMDIPAYLEDYDASIPIFNSAVVLFHVQQYAAALTVLEPLYHNIEVIDEPAALRICALMLDTALAAGQPRKACDVLRYMERVFGLGILVTPLEIGSSIPAQLMAPSSKVDSASTTGGTGISVNLASSTVPEASLTRSSSEEVLDEEVLSLGLDMEGSNTVKSAAPMSILANAVQGSPDRLASAPPRDSSVKISLHLNKVRFFLRTRNIRAAKKEVKLAMNLAQGVDHSKALMLKAQLEYLRGNHRKAIKLLMTCIGKEPGLRCMFLNNLGCIYHHLRKDSVAYNYFQKALQSCTSAASTKPFQISTFSQDRTVSVLYNCGLQQLRIGNPILAAKCFQEAGSCYYRQPLLWLRIAECCISALEKGLLEPGEFDNLIKKDELRVSSVGEGKWRRLLLPAGSLNPSVSNIKLGLTLDDGTVLSPLGSSYLAKGSAFCKSQKLSLMFARQCLHNALHLINELLAQDAKSASETRALDVEEPLSEDLKSLSLQASKGSTAAGLQTNPNGNNKDGKVNSLSAILASVTTFEEDQRKQSSTILQYVLADLAFVELCLDNSVRALKFAWQLLQCPDCTIPFRFLGRMYAAEALCILNRPKEAVIELSACVTENNNLDMPANGGDEDGQRWKSGENSEVSAEGDDGISNGVPCASTISEALNLSSLTGTRARASLFVNLAMVNVMLHEFSQAQHFAMQAVSITPANPVAVLCVVYVNLVQGRIQEAVALLKHCRHLYVKSV